MAAFMTGAELLELAASKGLHVGHLPAVPARSTVVDCEDQSQQSARHRQQPEHQQQQDDPPSLGWWAASLHLAGDPAAVQPLWEALLHQALRSAKQGKWPRKVRSTYGLVYWCEPLSALVLDEELHSALFQAAPVLLRAAYMQVTARVWQQQLAERYAVLQAAFMRWRAQGLSEVRQRLLDGRVP
jgi:hypothetical protein